MKTHPLLLEVNTRCWLQALSATAGRRVTLGSVPDALLAEWAATGFTHIWLMGVWTTGPLSRARALAHSDLLRTFDRVLPGWSEEDVAGSPYAVARYEIPEALGGREGLLMFRSRLRAHGLGLILDFVPNHVGLDHAWIEEHPEYFVQSGAEHPFAFCRETQDGVRWIVHGKDPHFPPWDDTAQLDYRRSDVHRAMLEELLDVAALCDGVRCDMAMLLVQRVFDQTWEEFPTTESTAAATGLEFWAETIRRVNAVHRDFLFLAEVYWGMEERLQELGFHYTYDKPLADGLLGDRPGEAIRHVQGMSLETLRRGIHFLENHDERRVASVLSPEEHQAVALALLALPGMRFLQDGQMDGARIHTPVQLARRAAEPVNPELRDMYLKLLRALSVAGVGRGEGRVLPVAAAWNGNSTWERFLAVLWGDANVGVALVIVNLSGHRGQCRIPLAVIPSAVDSWQLADRLSDEVWTRTADELRHPGLFLDVPAHAGQVFVLKPQVEPVDP